MVFKLKSDIRIGLGILRDFDEEVAYLCIQRPLIICDQNLMDSDYFKEVVSGIKSFAKKGRFLPLKLTGEPSYELLSSLLGDIDLNSFDGIVSIGGGSLMDVGKGLALLASNPTEPKKLKGFPQGLNTPLPHITIPSVLGSGAEASFNAVFIDEKEGRKLGINSVNNFPVLVLSDPLLTMSAPTSVVISSALDCMVHSVDSFGSVKASSVSQMFSVEAFQNIWSFLLKMDLDNPSDRLLLAKASVLGIYGLMNSGDGPTNGFAYYFGVRNKIPHGMAGGMFLKDVMRWNFANGYRDYDRLIQHTDTADLSEFFDMFRTILDQFSVPCLANYGYEQDTLNDTVHQVGAALGGSFAGNPIPFNEESALWVLEQQFKGK